MEQQRVISHSVLKPDWIVNIQDVVAILMLYRLLQKMSMWVVSVPGKVCRPAYLSRYSKDALRITGLKDFLELYARNPQDPLL
jgi:hypothetical protein